ncbi:MAG: hypothetical protein ACW967_09315, partial [Candidatus Hodarchaeales archaeon]
SKILIYKLDNLVTELETEIRNLESELIKWEHIDTSAKERIKKSQFTKYLQEAIETAKKQF